MTAEALDLLADDGVERLDVLSDGLAIGKRLGEQRRGIRRR